MASSLGFKGNAFPTDVLAASVTVDAVAHLLFQVVGVEPLPTVNC